MKKKVIGSLFVLLAILLCLPALAQGKRARKVVYTTLGQKFTGKILNETDKIVRMRIEGGIVTIPVSVIERRADLVKESKFQLIVVRDKKLAERINEEIRYGGDFTELAEKHSVDLSVLDKGFTGWLRQDGTLPAEVSKIVFDLRKDGCTRPVEVKDKGVFYLVKMIESREIEKDLQARETPPDGESSETEQGDAPPMLESPIVKVGVLPAAETTREARTAYLGSEIQDLLISIMSEATGLEVTAFREKPEADKGPSFIISGEIAKSGAAYSIQFSLFDDLGNETMKTDKLTAVCTVDSADDLVKAVRKLSNVLVKRLLPGRGY